MSCLETTRRGFLGGALAMAAAGCTGTKAGASVDPNAFIKAMLIHLGSNMWCDVYTPADEKRVPSVQAVKKYKNPWCDKSRVDYLRADFGIWRDVTAAMARAKLNMIVIDLGEALVYPSHPELGVKGSWAPSKMREELARLREMGLEPIPKLNFSATHNAWMKDWRYRIATPEYLKTTRELIEDAVEIFGGPRFVHIGYDEETIGHQGTWGRYEFIACRRGELWWHDFLYTVDCVRKAGSRAWCFSDQIWYEPELFRSRMPKDVVQCPWNFNDKDPKRPWYRDQIDDIAALGMDLIPDCGQYPSQNVQTANGGESWTYTPIDRADDETETRKMMAYCAKHVPQAQLKGFIGCPWVTLTPGIPCAALLDAIAYSGEEFNRFELTR